MQHQLTRPSTLLETISHRSQPEQVHSHSLSFKDNIIDKLATMTTLTQILLMENQIESLSNLKQLSALKLLTELDFTDCPVAREPNYRPTLFDR